MQESVPPVYIVSGGEGSSGEQLVRTALAQFKGADVPVIIIPRAQRVDQLRAVVEQAVSTGGIIVHTLVNGDLRSKLIDLARERNIVAVDLMGLLLLQLAKMLGAKPLGRPGLYRQIREDYFKRIEAIEFTVDHDDGRKPHELRLAEIVLTGVSRVGKTPLSMFLSTRGWKVANVPLIKEVPPPRELFKVNRGRVVGLTIHPDQLVFYRRRRQASLGTVGQLPYADPEALEAEIKFAQRVFSQGQFAVVDMTDKPIEEAAEEVVAHVTHRPGPD